SIQKNVEPKSETINIVISNRVTQETIGEMVHQLLRDKLSIRDIKVETHALALSASNANGVSSRLSRLRRELRNLNASLEIIEATKFPDITEEANKIQRVNRKKAEAKRIDYPDEFTLESVKERFTFTTSTVKSSSSLDDSELDPDED